MSSPIATLRILLGLDAREVETGVDKANKAASGFGTGAKVAFGVAAGAAAAGFGLMAKGALEMERAQGEFQAATGASREEAVQFSKDMNGLVGTSHTVGMSFEDIASAGIKVAQQFGVTGDEATALTDDILGFAKVTGQDATQAAADLEDTLSAYGLSADDAAGFMDKLVASNQKFGTEVGPEALATLRNIGPALTAMGEDLDTGIEFLNGFEKAGLDATTAQKALTKAVGELKPGQTLDDLIAQLSGIEDPLLRAQAAAEIFGTKAGPTLAKVIQPGMTSLDSFGVSAEEAAGSVDKAADDMLTTGDKIAMFAEQAGAKLRGLGQDVGPLLSGAAGLVSLGSALGGPKVLGALASALSGLWTKIASNLTVLAAAGAAGVAEGEAQAAGATGASALNTWLQKFGLMTPSKVAAAEVEGGIVGAAEGKAQAAAATGAIGATGGAGASAAGLGLGSLFGIFFVAAASIPVLDWLDKTFGQTPAQAEANAKKAVKPMADALTVFAAEQQANMGGAGDAAIEAFERTFSEGAAGLALDDTAGWQDLTARAKQAAIDAGVASGDSWAISQQNALEGGLSSGAAQMDAYMAMLGERHAQAVAAGYAMSEDEIADDIRETTVQAGLQAQADAAAAFHAFGVATAEALGAGMTSAEATGALFSDIDTLKDALEKYLSPREQALKLIGGDYVDTLIEGLQSADPDLQRAAQGLAIGSIATIEQAGLKGKKGQKGLREIGRLYDALLASGMTDDEAKALLAAEGVTGVVLDELKPGQPEYNAGKDTTHKYGEGLRDPTVTAYVQSGAAGIVSAWRQQIVAELGSRATKSQIGAAIRASMGALHGESPPKEGPLMHIDDWAVNVAHAWIDPLVNTLAGGRRAIGRALEGTMPTLAGAGGAAAGSVALGGGGVVINGGVNVTVNGGGDPDTIRGAVVAALDDYVRRAQRLAGTTWAPAGSTP